MTDGVLKPKDINEETKKMENIKRSLSVKELHETKQTERAERFKEMGLKEVVRLKEGENYININTAENVKEISTNWGDKYIYDLIEPADRVLMASDYLSRLILSVLAQQENGEINIIKFVDNKGVKYKVFGANDEVLNIKDATPQ